MSGSDRLVAAIAAVCALAVGLALTGQWLLFGTAIWLLMALELVLGFGRAGRSRLVRASAAALFLAFTGLLAGMDWLHDPSAGPRTFLGFPAGSALLLYGVWPIGLALTILVTAAFDRAMPKDRVERLLAEHGRRGEER